MDVVDQRLHIRKLLVGRDLPVRVARPFPRIVDIDEGVALARESAAHHAVRRGPHLRVVHAAAPDVPRVPSERRRQRQHVRAADDGDLAGCLPETIRHRDIDDRAARLLDRAADDPGRCIQPESAREVPDAEGQRRLSGRRYEKQERAAGCRADDPRRVETRLWMPSRDDRGRFGRQRYYLRSCLRVPRELEQRAAPDHIVVPPSIAAIADRENELLRALEIGAQQLRCVAALHHARRCGELAIHPHVERCAADTGLAEVVNADHRGEPRRGSFQVDGEIGVHIERDAVHVLDAAERELQRRWRRGLTSRGARAADRRLTEIEAVDPDGASGRVGQTECLSRLLLTRLQRYCEANGNRGTHGQAENRWLHHFCPPA